jgi:hypothetical protein
MAEEKKKQKRPTLTSAKGVFKYPRLNEPDYGNDKFPKPDGEFSVTLVLKQADADAFVNAKQKALDGKSLADLHTEAVDAAKEAFGKMKKPAREKLGKVSVNPIYTVLYDEEENATGEVSFKFAMKYKVAVWKNGKKTDEKRKNECVIFDAKGLRMTKAPNIWGGTVGKVSFSPSPYFVEGTGAAGLKLSLNAVQIIDLVSNGAKSASGYGFEEEEGYAYEAPAAEEKDEFSDETSEQAGTENPADDGSSDF